MLLRFYQPNTCDHLFAKKEEENVNLKMHVCDEGVVELWVLVDGLVAGADHLQQLLPPLERVVVLPDQKADERKLKLGQNFVDPEKF